jgi:hypothetical protein
LGIDLISKLINMVYRQFDWVPREPVRTPRRTPACHHYLLEKKAVLLEE